MALKMTKKVITCTFCNAPASDKKLYKCVEDDCDKYGEPYCERDGKISHENIDDHKFDLNADNIQKISFNEHNECHNIGKGMIKVDSALTTYEEQQYGPIRQIYFGGASGALCQVKTFANAHNVVKNMKGAYNVVKNINTSTGMGTVADVATDGVKIIHMTASQTVISTASEIAGPAAVGAGIGAVVMAGYEVVLHSYRYWNGDIETAEEYKYCLASGLSASLGMGIGNWGGTVIGASIGSLGGPIGALIGGIIGGILGGAWGAKIGRSTFEKYSPNDFIYNEQKKKKKTTEDHTYEIQ
eukprot:373205_1